jgi:dephospho-CoA kinase
MVLIGIAGGIASGKSLVSGQLQRLGAEVLDADRAGHQVLGQPQVIQTLHKRWGDRVLRADGRLDRKRIAEIVFSNSPDAQEELLYLEQITHPRIGQLLQNRIDTLARQGQTEAGVLDAPVMFKAGWDRLCDTILFVDAPRRLRLARARARGWSESEFRTREAAQDALDSKRRRAKAIIDNSSTPEYAFSQVKKFWCSLGLSVPQTEKSTPVRSSGGIKR